MRLDFFMLAEAAHATSGKLFIHGGALTNVAPPSVPWIHPQLSYVIRVEFEATDEGRDHELGVRMTAPNGEEVAPSIIVPITSEQAPARAPGRPIFFNAALTVARVPMPEYGEYRIDVSLDRKPVHVERFFVNEPAP